MIRATDRSLLKRATRLPPGPLLAGLLVWVCSAGALLGLAAFGLSVGSVAQAEDLAKDVESPENEAPEKVDEALAGGTPMEGASPGDASPEDGAQRRAPTAEAAPDGASALETSTPEPQATPYRPFDICDWCPPQRRAPTLDRCDVSTGYAEDLCNPKRQGCGPWWKPVSGDLRFEYRFRSTDDSTDHTAWQFANVRLGDQQAAGWSAAFHGAVIENFDPSDTPGFDPLFSIWDTYGNITGQVYHAYITYRPERGIVRMARVGRMWIDAGEVLQVDGGLVDFWPTGTRRTRDFGFKVFTGIPSYLFESSPSGDFVAGFEVSSKLWRNARARLTYAYIKNNNRAYGNVQNNLTTLTIDQRLRQGSNLQLRYQQIDDRPRFLTARFNSYSMRSDLQVTAWVNTLLTRQVQQVYDTDLFYGVLRDFEPYMEGYVSVSKGIGRCLDVEGLVAIRRLYESAEVRAFNREFERYAVTLSAFDWPSSCWSASITGEWWNDTEDYGAATFDVEWRPSKRTRVRFGTDYSLYSRDVFTLQERVDSYGVYARLRYDFTCDLQGWFKLRVEDDSFDTYTLLRTGLTWEF